MAIVPGDPKPPGLALVREEGERWPVVEQGRDTPVTLPRGPARACPLAPTDVEPFAWWCALPTDSFYERAVDGEAFVRFGWLTPLYLLGQFPMLFFWPSARAAFIEEQQVIREENLALAIVDNSVPEDRKHAVRTRVFDYYHGERNKVRKRHPLPE